MDHHIGSQLNMIREDDLIDDLIHNIYCRLRPSSIHGIGVFAIRPIPKDTNPFVTLSSATKPQEDIAIPVQNILKNPQIPDVVKDLVTDFYAVSGGNMYFPPKSFNELSIAYCMNHSETPNVITHDGGNTFVTARQIEAGEEVFIDYGSFSEDSDQ